MKNSIKQKRQKAERRRAKIRKTIRGTAKRPRLVVFRSPDHIYAQLVDDASQKTILTVTDNKIAKKKGIDKKGIARETGKELAKNAFEKNIKEVVFDRAGYKYHGRVRELAEGAREAGLKF